VEEGEDEVDEAEEVVASDEEWIKFRRYSIFLDQAQPAPWEFHEGRTKVGEPWIGQQFSFTPAGWINKHEIHCSNPLRE